MEAYKKKRGLYKFPIKKSERLYRKLNPCGKARKFKTCAWCKVRRVSKYHHFLCDGCKVRRIINQRRENEF